MYGFDGYGTFTEGANPKIVSSVPRWLIDFDPNYTGINDRYFVYISDRLFKDMYLYITTTNTMAYHTILVQQIQKQQEVTSRY